MLKLIRMILTLDNLLHLVGGFALATLLIVVGVPRDWAVAALFWFGLLREMWQHEWRLPSTLHVWAEALSWFVGALLAAAI